MLLSEVRDWFKINYFNISLFPRISINKIDNNLKNTLCIYNSKRNISPINNLQLSTYSVKPLTVLIRYGMNQTEAEKVINELYKFFDNKKTVIGNKKVSFKHCFENPINLGTDDNGIQEYSLEIDLYYEREG